MADLLIAICLNVSFWAGIGIVVATGDRRDPVGRILATATMGFVLVVVSLEILSVAGLINRVSIAAICLLTGLFGLLRRLTASHDENPAGIFSDPACSPAPPPHHTVLSFGAI